MIWVGFNVTLYSNKSFVVVNKDEVSSICFLAACPSGVFQLAGIISLGNRFETSTFLYLDCLPGVDLFVIVVGSSTLT